MRRSVRARPPLGKSRARQRGAGRLEASKPGKETRRVLLLFGGALATRLLFWRATPDAEGPFTAYFQGDALLWLDYARALDQGRPFELGLPIHPPATAYLISWLWSGEVAGVPMLRFWWCLLGALAVAILYLALLEPFGRSVAGIVGLAACFSTALLVLSTSLNNETPYLLIVLLAFWLFERWRREPRLPTLLAWSAVNGLACLFRVEHLLFYLAMLGYLALARTSPWRERGTPRTRLAPAKSAAVSLLFFLLPLVPWHLKAWRGIERFNSAPLRAVTPDSFRRRIAAVAWEPESLAMRSRLPAFARDTAAAFVATTVAGRGRGAVRASDFQILEEAFGYVPEPLAGFPFVSSYGPLNFFLANNAAADAGFSRAPLEAPPPLAGGAGQYPPELVAGLPPPDFSFVYPPHLKLFNEGYRLGTDWIRENPADFLRLAGRKLSIFWSGAAMGFTGYNLPLGLSGLRRSVDFVVPEGGAGALAWRLAVLALCAAGLVAGARRPALHPWLLFSASKLVVTLFFFGYARQGALVVPVVLLLSALAIDRWVVQASPTLASKTAIVMAVLLAVGLGIETLRYREKPLVTVDGRPVEQSDVFSGDSHRPRQIGVQTRLGRN